MKVAIIGECMLELSADSEKRYTMSYGGDTLNTAIYYSRLGGKAEYFTALGDDIYSNTMLEQWQAEGVGISYVRTIANQMPGLYIINNDQNGERYFHYWRQHAPARQLISQFPDVLHQLHTFDLIFLSGITLSLYNQSDLQQLFSCLQHFRAKGGIVVFDNNYRLRNWKSVDDAQAVFKTMMAHTDIALISFDDEVSMYGEHTPDECLVKWINAGVREVVIKNGESGCLLYVNELTSTISLPSVVKPVDTTAAGDSFNGAYLAAKLKGKTPHQCVNDAQICASIVIMHKGAIIDKSIDLTGANNV
ncbi:sugar kinase [Psychrosphaera sp. F3M07]|uniref:sugar kinase n=1 Tax=Psychrosphaera sp. F3M07 TaxID=2841560 RepID=UPI001C09C42A|nr:sugar kinase [Psychrosphaera sp. F3M07]